MFDKLAYQKAYRDSPAGRRNRKSSQLKCLYGITLTEWETLLAAQGGRCAICDTDEPGGRGDWHVDHSHETGEVRGLLCHACNTGIGSLKDDPALLRAALTYLEAPRKVLS